MSTCISRHGEFDSHEVGDDHVCKQCGVLDVDSFLIANAEQRLAKVRADALREAADFLRDDMDEPWGMRAANRLEVRADRIEAGGAR